jgi:DNA-binding MarR family transcriptional regulator
MVEQNYPKQPRIEYNEKILDLYQTLKKEFSEHLHEKSKQYGFTGPQLLLMFAICQNPGINLRDLSECLELSKSNVSSIVDRLVRQGKVTREIPEESRRSVKLYLSPDFLNKYNPMELRTQYMSGIIGDASVEELNLVIDGLEKFHELIKKSTTKTSNEPIQKKIQGGNV